MGDLPAPLVLTLSRHRSLITDRSSSLKISAIYRPDGCVNCFPERNVDWLANWGVCLRDDYLSQVVPDRRYNGIVAFYQIVHHLRASVHSPRRIA